MKRTRGEKTEGVTEDDLNEIKQDISSFRYDLLDILRNNGMKTPTYTHHQKSGKASRIQRRIKAISQSSSPKLFLKKKTLAVTFDFLNMHQLTSSFCDYIYFVLFVNCPAHNPLLVMEIAKLRVNAVLFTQNHLRVIYTITCPSISKDQQIILMSLLPPAIAPSAYLPVSQHSAFFGH